MIVALTIIAAYLRQPDPSDPGTTSVAALVVCYCLGAATWLGHAQLAVMLAVATTVLLYFKAQLRGMATQLDARDWISILQFGVLSLVILPILPNEEMGPYGTLNPHQIWWMVVLIAGVSLAGYAALHSPACAMARPSSACSAAWPRAPRPPCSMRARRASSGDDGDGCARHRDDQSGDGAARGGSSPRWWRRRWRGRARC